MNSKRTAAFIFVMLVLFGAASSPLWSETLGFNEIWAYLMDGEEKFLFPGLPVSDIGYFGAGINSQGKLAGVPDRPKLGAFPGRVHLVIAEIDNYALLHFCLDPSLPLRDRLVADIVQAAGPFDGVQIDFESVASKDRDNFCEFLGLLKKGLGAKTLSVAMPACTSEDSDRLGYAKVAALADRVIVMAYDEHWSGSEAGPVSSLTWCKNVADYARSKVDPGRLVMGSPFYGRAWADKNLARAYKYSSLEGILAEKSIGPVQRQDGIPYVEYVETVNVKVYFDDAASILARLGAWRAASVRNVAFWRLGQEDKAVWGGIGLAAPAASSDPAQAAALPSAGG
jgi:hypothetical protein